LGNVTTVVSDRQYPYGDGLSSDVIYYKGDILSSQEYYPFGSLMPGRESSTDGYRYGFNGKEMDNEVSGIGNQYDYGFRIYNPRLGKFLSVDPLSSSYPWYTPYQFAGNTPIHAIDLDGLEILDFRSVYTMKVGKVELNNGTFQDVLYLVSDGSNHKLTMYPFSKQRNLNSKFISGTDLQNEVQFKAAETTAHKTFGTLGVINNQIKRSSSPIRTGSSKGAPAAAAGKAAEFLMKSIIEVQNSERSLDADDKRLEQTAFDLAYKVVNINRDAIGYVFNNIEWSENFEEAIANGEVNFSSDNFIADIINYMVDYRSTEGDFSNFSFNGFSEDYKKYRILVMRVGQVLNEMK